MSTIKLYYQDQYIKNFNANIVDIKQKDGKYNIILDKTAFFPGGGGQGSDIGKIDGYNIEAVIEEKNEIVHILNEKPEKTEDLYCEIDWEKRYDGMQQHLAQHVLSGCFYSLFNANTAGIHLGNEISTVDIVGTINQQQIIEAERKANQIIFENHAVEFVTTTRKEAKLLGLRRDLATKDQTIRVVRIHDLDINACCGVHPSSTLELQLIRIKRAESHKGNTRIEFLAGNRAVCDYLERDRILDGVCNTLSAGDLEVEKSLTNLIQKNKEVNEENSKLKSSLAEYQIKELIERGNLVNGILIIQKIYSDVSMKFLTKIANKLVEEENRVVLFAIKDKDKASLLFSCSKNIKDINMNVLLKDAVSLIDGRGGGSNILAQGAGKNILNLENAIEYANRKLINNLEVTKMD
jgi:alanyl-tRNA synthetase